MLKSSKLSRKSHKSKDSSIRKSHLSRKSMRSRSPVRHPGSSRPSSMKHMSSGMKRGHAVHKRKTSPHSPRLRPFSSSPHRSLSHRSKPESPVAVDRARPMKSLKYDKRRRLSNSPERHLGPSSSRRPVSPHVVRDMSPYMSDQYPSNTIPHPQQFSPPIRKKIRRSVSASPPRRHPPGPIHSDVHVPHRAVSPIVHPKHQRSIPLIPVEREKLGYDVRNKRGSSHVMPRSHSKDVALKMPYSDQDPRYRSPSPSNRYPSTGSKVYGPTLHERFSSVIESSRNEPRVRYSREDLEKITIDVRNPTPASRLGIIPSNTKLIRRGDDAHRPIFDREEIKAARYLHEEVYVESKSSPYGSSHAVDLRNVENYQVTRHRYDSHHEVASSASGRPINNRWPDQDIRKNTVILDRDEREKEYERVPVSRSSVEMRSRSRSGDRDFRSERYTEPKPSNSRAVYPNRPPPPPEPRNSVPYLPRKNDMPPDSRHKLNYRKNSREIPPSAVRSEVRSQYVPPLPHYSDDLPPPRVDRRDHSPIPEPHRWEYKSRSPSREKFSDYPRRPEKYDYKPYQLDIPPKGPSHFEHEPREGPSSFRGGSRPFRSPRGRGRGFRGSIRGSSYRGSSYRGGYRPSIPRGRGIPRR